MNDKEIERLRAKFMRDCDAYCEALYQAGLDKDIIAVNVPSQARTAYQWWINAKE